MTLTAELLERPGRDALHVLEGVAARYGAFLGLPASFEVNGPRK